jgi:hypothetical protein
MVLDNAFVPAYVVLPIYFIVFVIILMISLVLIQLNFRLNLGNYITLAVCM